LRRRDVCPGKKRGRAVGKTKRGKSAKIMAVAGVAGFPLALHVASASPHEVDMVEYTLEYTFTKELPERLISDKAYDSYKLDATLEAGWGTQMIAPNRKKRSKTQNGRPLQRYRRRWKIERMSAWLQNFRRLVVRYEFHAENFLAMAQLGCTVILLRLIMRCLLMPTPKAKGSSRLPCLLRAP
jgi:transposase